MGTDKKDGNKTKAAQYKENLRVLSTTTPKQLVRSVVRGDGFTGNKSKKGKV